MRSQNILITALCIGGAVACTFSPESPSSDQTHTLRLSQTPNGDLEYCDPQTGDCVDVSNPNSCAVVEIEIDTATGATCERCLDDAGQVTYESCGEASVACTVVTAPEPDCVVCAHIDGPVIFSSCTPSTPDHCEFFPVSTPGGVEQCEVCYDTSGNITRNECGVDCSAVLCAEVQCEAGYRSVTPSGQCCPICVPVENCEELVCPNTSIPDCPPGTNLQRSQDDCCGYECVPDDCSEIMCPLAVLYCPPGTHESYEEPYCCGTCVPDEPTECYSEQDCAAGRHCSVTDGDCFSPGCDGSDASCSSPGVCAGICVPDDPIECPVYAAPEYFECDGEWTYGQTDSEGCPLPPQCLCPDGSVSWTGECHDVCALVDCAQMIEECPEGTEISFESPYCCGTCVSSDKGLCLDSGGDWDIGCGNRGCTTMEANCEFSDAVPSCDCGPTMAWVDGQGCVFEPSCQGNSCLDENGQSIPDGTSFPADDGCNSCACTDGQITCLAHDCADECWGAWTDSNGTCRAPNDGAYPAECCSEQNLCENTGGYWNEQSCGHYGCGQGPTCDALIPGCDCGPSSVFEEGFGCVENPDQCGTPVGCVDDSGQGHGEGDSFPSGDGCNWCSCWDGMVVCTEMACQQ